MISAWWLLLVPVGFFAGHVVGLNSRVSLKYDHRDKYAEAGDD